MPSFRKIFRCFPDELRHETLVFTRLNTVLLLINLVVTGGSFVAFDLKWQPPLPGRWQPLLEQGGQWVVWFMILLTTATTMALIWKTKEVIFNSVFGGSR